MPAIDLFPYFALPVFVLGLGDEGRAACRALEASGAEVAAWDVDEKRRRAALDQGLELGDPNEVDWRERFGIVLDCGTWQGVPEEAEIVSRAERAGCELVSDVELLARSERDAQYIAVLSRTGASEVLDLLAHVYGVCGRELEVGGDPGRPVLGLRSAGAEGGYAIAMSPLKCRHTVSMTFDVALFLDVGVAPWPPCRTVEEAVALGMQVFHRQTAPRAAVINRDVGPGEAALQGLGRQPEQRLIPVSARSPVPRGVFTHDGVLYDATEGPPKAIAPIEAEELSSLHQCAVYAAALASGIPRHAALASLRTYSSRGG